MEAEIHSANYRVDLGVFQGPLDLLLYLIRKEEVDIADIPIAKITRQYLNYIELMQTLNLDVVGEYILMAATLIRIKTRMLLPREETDSDEFDPREELIMALMEYKKYREASEILRERALIEERNFVPAAAVEKPEEVVDNLPATSLFDLLTVFREVMATQGKETAHNVVAEEIKIEDRVLWVLQYLQRQPSATFAQLFEDIGTRIAAVVTFIALLELVRSRRIRIQQSFPFAELRVYRGDCFSEPLRPIDLVSTEQTTPELVEQ